MSTDAFTMAMRLCDDQGQVSDSEIVEDRESADRTYLDRCNRLRSLGWDPLYRGTFKPITEPFTCTSSAHLAGEHIRCTSKAHQLKLPRNAHLASDRERGKALLRIAAELRELVAGEDVDKSLHRDIDTVHEVGMHLLTYRPIVLFQQRSARRDRREDVVLHARAHAGVATTVARQRPPSADPRLHRRRLEHAAMKVLAGTLTAAERAIVFESNRSARRILVASKHGCLTRDQHGAPHCEEPVQAVGTVTGWSYENFQLGGVSFEWSIPWESAVRIWWRDEAPDEADVRALLEEAAAA